MASNLTIQFDVPVTKGRFLPQQFSQQSLPGSAADCVTGAFGTICVQSLFAAGISLYYVLAELADPVNCVVKGTDTYLFVQVLFEGIYECRAKSISCLFTHPNHYSIVRIKEQSLSIHFQKQPQLSCVLIAYPVSYIQSILPFYPWLEEIENALNNHIPVLQEKNASIAISEKIYNLLHTPYASTTEKYFGKLLIEIVGTAFGEYTITEKKTPQFSLYDISCIHAAKEYMDANLREHITIVQLSRKAGINRLKLKKGFKEMFGMGIHGYQLQMRLIVAKTALETTMKPIHQIARQSGYKKASNFSASFKKAFGVTPFRYRKNYRKKR